MVGKTGMFTAKRLLDRMRSQSDFPAVLQHITEINTMTSPSSNCSANELASIILKDYSLTCKLLKVVNSAMYHQFSGQISTITRAVVILGFEQIRITATGLMFFAHLQDKSTTPHVKEAVLSSFLSGMLAQDLSQYQKIEDWEDHFICAMFHNFGRLLVMYYFPDKYEEYLKLVTEGDRTEKAMQKTLGTTFDELGMEVADLWHLPQLIINGMKIISDQDIRDSNDKIDQHRKMANFANELCDITINYSPDQRRDKLREVLKKYKNSYDILEDDIVKMMDSALIKMREFADVLNLKKADLNKLDERSFRVQSDEDIANSPEEQAMALDTMAPLERFTITTEKPPVTSTGTGTGTENKQQLMLDTIKEISNILLDDFDLDAVLTMILETIYRGIGFNQVLILFYNAKTNTLQPRFGFGQNIKELLLEFCFQVESNSKDLFNLALTGGRDFFIGNISAPDINQHKPSWFRDILFAPCFALYPIIVNKKPIGLIYGSHTSPDHHLNQQQMDTLRTLRNQAALAIKLSATGIPEM